MGDSPMTTTSDGSLSHDQQVIRELSLEYQTEQRVKACSLWRHYDAYTDRIADLTARLTTLHDRTLPSKDEGQFAKETNESNLKKELYTLRRDRSAVLASIDAHRREVRRDLISGADIVAATLSSR